MTSDRTLFFTALKQTVELAIPVVGSRLALMINNFGAMVLIGRLGHAQLAVGALISGITTLLLMSGISILYSVGIMTGNFYGSRKKAQAGVVLRSGFVLGTLLAVPMIAIMRNIDLVLHFFRQSPALIILAQNYLNAFSWCILPLTCNVVINQFLIAINRPRITLWLNCLRPIITLPLGYCFLFGKFGFPKFGIAGMGYAMTFMSWFLLLLGVIYLYSQQKLRDYKIFNLNVSFSFIRQLFVIGWPIAVQFAAEMTSFVIGTFFIGWFGEFALAASQIVIQYNMVVVMIPFGLSQASGVLVAQALGRGDRFFTKYLANVSIIIGLIFAVFVIGLYLMLPRLLSSVYIDIADPSVLVTVRLAVLLFSIAAFSLLFDGVRNITTGVLRGFKDTRIPMIIGVLVAWFIAIPLGYLLAFFMHLGAAGIFFGRAVGFLLGAVILLKRFYGKFASRLGIRHPHEYG